MKLDSWHQPTYGSLGVVSHMFLDLLGILQEQLTTALQEVLEQPISLRAEPDFKRGSATVEFWNGPFLATPKVVALAERMPALRVVQLMSAGADAWVGRLRESVTHATRCPVRRRRSRRLKTRPARSAQCRLWSTASTRGTSRPLEPPACSSAGAT